LETAGDGGLGCEDWKEAHSRGKRWSVEGIFSTIKRISGEPAVARRWDLMLKEMRAKFALYIMLLQSGIREGVERTRSSKEGGRSTQRLNCNV